MVSKINYTGVAHLYRGKSTDTKPVLTVENNGATFYEMDTRTTFMFDGETLSWINQSNGEVVPGEVLPSEPGESTLFFLSTPPRQANTRYAITADGVIEADKELMA